MPEGSEFLPAFIKHKKDNRMKSKIYSLFLSAVMVGGVFTSCSKDESAPVFPDKPTYDMSGFAKGADVSWLTEMEKSGSKFYDNAGRETECLNLLRDLGMNSIRLRVWVNPSDGWCNKEDMLAKAFRANSLGYRLMIDFHYSDVWADPGQQYKPTAWESYSFDELQTAVADHTKEVLSALKDMNITPEWVQVGNETGNGMLWDEGKADKNMAGYAALTSAGYDAVKEIFPNTQVIVHLQEGDRKDLFTWIFDGLRDNGAKWDLIGMSLYPEADTWQQLTADCVANISYLYERYGTKSIICEVGMAESEPEATKEWLTEFLSASKATNQCLGIFYWEPQAYGNWKAYGKGAFDDSGRPTIALDAFKN